MAESVIRIKDLWKNYGEDGSGAPALRAHLAIILNEEISAFMRLEFYRISLLD